MRAHANADGRDFYDVCGARHFLVANIGLVIGKDFEGTLVIGGRDSEGQVGCLGIIRDNLDDHIDIDIGIGQRHEDRSRNAGLIGHIAQCDLRFILGIGDA